MRGPPLLTPRLCLVPCEVCVTNVEGGVDVGDIFIGGAVREMEACWPSSVGPAGAGAKPPSAALAEDRRGEREGKRRGLIASGGDREDVPEALGRGHVVPGLGVRC